MDEVAANVVDRRQAQQLLFPSPALQYCIDSVPSTPLTWVPRVSELLEARGCLGHLSLFDGSDLVLEALHFFPMS